MKGTIMPKDIKVKIRQGTILLNLLNRISFPEKLSTREFSYPVRSTFNKEMRRLYRALKDYSPLLKEDSLLLFGPVECYKNLQEGGVAEERAEKYVCTKPNHEVTVALTPDAVKGLYRALLLILHPASAASSSIGLQEDVAWPLAESIKATKSLEEDIGLSKNETVEIKWDEEEKEQSASQPDS